MRDTIVFDTYNKAFYGNEIFKPDVAKNYPGALSFVALYNEAIRKGYKIMTGDVAVNEFVDGRRLVVISEIGSALTPILIRKGAELAAVFSLEPPSVAWRFYRDLPKLGRIYRHVFAFGGAAGRMGDANGCFHPTLFPQSGPAFVGFEDAAWTGRKFMLLVNSNLVHLVLGPARIWAAMRDSEFRSELYSERRRAIRHFHRRDGFHLYGRGWDRWRFGASLGSYLAAQRCYRGIIPGFERKLAVMSDYRFCICFENSIYPGYISEKIFDAFSAGCVPIYYGAPDISSYVPDDCYIDFRRFPNYPALESYLDGYGQKEFNRHRQAVVAFLKSGQFELFSHRHFAAELLRAVTNNGEES